MKKRLVLLFSLASLALVSCGGGDSSTTSSVSSSPASHAGCMKATGGPTDACLIAVQATTTEAACNTLGGCSGTKSDGTFVYSKALSGCATQKDAATGKPSSSTNCDGAIAASTSTDACTDLGANHPQGHWGSVKSNDKTLRTKLKCAVVIPTTSGS